MAKITVGPVIGKVTDTTARILIEVDEDVSVECIATDSNNTAVTLTGNAKENRAFVFKFEGLSPGSKYKITFTGVDETYPESLVRTFRPDLEGMNIAAVSCNYYTKDETQGALWKSLRDKYVIPGDANLLLHLGDQVYGDRVFMEAMRIIGENDPPDPELQDKKILELYRGLYRTWWTQDAIRETLANISNLMIWDDHEIRDDWGSDPEDSDKNSKNYRIGTLARQAYREYQRQLWDDFDTDLVPAEGDSDEHHSHAWNQVGVLFIDQRGGRTFGKDPARPYLGTRQWNDISDRLLKGELSKIRALIVVTSVPLVYMGIKITQFGSSAMNDLLDHWSHPNHAKEQIEMIRLLRQWKDEGNGSRELLVIGGDVHVGGYADIEHEGKVIFRQMITSPITNDPPPFFAFHGIKLLTETAESLGNSNYSFEHNGLTNERNYGFIMVRVPQDTGQIPKIEGTVIVA